MVSVGVSPACAFVSGKGDGSYIEICRGLDIVRVVVDADGNAVALDGEEGEPSPAHQEAVDACSFCFAQTHLKPVFDLRSDFSGSIVRVRGGVVYGHGGQVFARPVMAAHGVRAPPFFS